MKHVIVGGGRLASRRRETAQVEPTADITLIGRRGRAALLPHGHSLLPGRQYIAEQAPIPP